MNLDNLGGGRSAQFLHPFSRSAPAFTDTELNNYFSMHHSETEKVHNTLYVWYILNKKQIYICFAPVVQPLGLGRKMRYLNKLIISYEKENQIVNQKQRRLKSTIEHQIPKAQTKPYRAYHKAAQSKERGKKKAKNTVKQKINDTKFTHRTFRRMNLLPTYGKTWCCFKNSACLFFYILWELWVIEKLWTKEAG